MRSSKVNTNTIMEALISLINFVKIDGFWPPFYHHDIKFVAVHQTAWAVLGPGHHCSFHIGQMLVRFNCEGQW